MVEAVGELVEAGAVVALELVDARVGLAETGGEIAHAGAFALQFGGDFAHVGAFVAARAASIASMRSSSALTVWAKLRVSWLLAANRFASRAWS